MRAWLERLLPLKWRLIRGRSGRSDILLLASSVPEAPRPAPAPPAPRTDISETQRRERIDSRARAIVSRVFAASQPVDDRRSMCGRTDELAQLTAAVVDNRMHGIIYGPRGSGKTSLARVFGDYADERGLAVIYNSCAGGTSFAGLMTPYLVDLGPVPFGMRPVEFDDALATLRLDANPRTLATFLARIEHDDVLLILDEFDRIENAALKAQMAILVKLLTDMRVGVRLLFVGISGDVDDLIGSHASVRRHVVALAVAPLPDDEIAGFITSTAAIAGMTFTDEARGLLRWVIQGSPYHMRLFALHGAMAALEAGSRMAAVDHVMVGLRAALAGWRGMNGEDAVRFATLVENPAASLAGIEAVAIRAARDVEFTLDGLRDSLRDAGVVEAAAMYILTTLAPSFAHIGSRAGRLMFSDVLAPQFLLATCAIVRDSGRSGETRVIERVSE